MLAAEYVGSPLGAQIMGVCLIDYSATAAWSARRHFLAKIQPR